MDFQQQNSYSLLLMPSNKNSITRTITRTHEPQDEYSNRIEHVSSAERCLSLWVLPAGCTGAAGQLSHCVTAARSLTSGLFPHHRDSTLLIKPAHFQKRPRETTIGVGPIGAFFNKQHVTGCDTKSQERRSSEATLCCQTWLH